MRGMFYGCSLLKEINLPSFNYNNIKDIRYMFDDISISCNLICNDQEINEEFNQRKISNQSRACFIY